MIFAVPRRWGRNSRFAIGYRKECVSCEEIHKNVAATTPMIKDFSKGIPMHVSIVREQVFPDVQ